MSTLYISGIQNTKEEEVIIKETFIKTTNNVEWLKKGETVLIKPALNSPDPYPATTHPKTIKIITDILIKKGAKVIIGDQSGVGHVLHGPEGVLKGSSSHNYAKSGMKTDNKARFIGFEEEGWDKGFFHFKSKDTSSWQNGFYITNWINKADHMISLPRLSTHVQAGVTLGFKNMVGLLREDSRLEFHMNGPLSTFMKIRAKQADIDVKNDKSNSFFNKIVEISLAIRSKLRLTMITATKAQVTLGPDKKMICPFFSSQVVSLNPGVVIASSDQAAVEIFGIALLTFLYQELKERDKKLQKIVLLLNKQIKELGTYSVYENPFVRHALKLNLGEKNVTPVWNNISKTYINHINTLLKT